MLRRYLTKKNHKTLLKEAAGKTKREVKKLIAKHFPQPDVPPKIRKLPDTARKQAVREAKARGEKVASPPTEPRPGSVEPLSEYRYKVEFTADQEFCDDLQELTDLLRHSNPTGDMAVTLKRAVKSHLAEVKKRLRGQTTHPRGAPKNATKRGYVVRDELRKIFERDGDQCTFISEDGTRCSARDFLQLHHETPRAVGGADTAENVRVLCRAHNLLLARNDFGRDFIEQTIKLSRQRARARGHRGEVEGAGRRACGARIDPNERHRREDTAPARSLAPLKKAQHGSRPSRRAS